MAKRKPHTSFLDDLKVGDRFYFVNSVIYRQLDAREYSHVDFRQHLVTEVTRQSVTFVTTVVNGWVRPQKEKVMKRDLRKDDYMNDLMGGYKRTYDQAIYFLKKYHDMFTKPNTEMSDEEREYHLSFMKKAINNIESGLIYNR